MYSDKIIYENNMDNEVIRMLISIYMVVWTFSTSLLLFFLNNREKKICGISYEKVFKVHMKTINFLKAALCLPIFEVIICVWKKNANVLVGLTMVQTIIAVMLIWMINRIIQLSAVKKTVHKQLKKKMIYLYDSKNLQIKSNWSQMLLYDILKTFEFQPEEEYVVTDALEKLLKQIPEKRSQLHYNDEIEEENKIRIYLMLFETILFDDEKLQKRWNMLVKVIFKNEDVDIKKALAIYLVKNNRRYERKFLNELFERVDLKMQIQQWALAANFYCMTFHGNEWRENYYIRLEKLIEANIRQVKESDVAYDSKFLIVYLGKKIRQISAIYNISIVQMEEKASVQFKSLLAHII